MFWQGSGGIVYVPEPLVASRDVIIAVKRREVIVRVRYTAVDKSTEESDKKDRHFFASLRKLDKTLLKIDDEATREMRTALANKRPATTGPRSRLKKKKVKKKEAGRRTKSREEKKLERLKKSFLSAAKFVRQKAKDYVSPSEKLDLWALFHQAKMGDADPEAVSTNPTSLTALKHKRWREHVSSPCLRVGQPASRSRLL